MPEQETFRLAAVTALREFWQYWNELVSPGKEERAPRELRQQYQEKTNCYGAMIRNEEAIHVQTERVREYLLRRGKET